jgi:Calx-beta domain-containing protein
MRQACGAMLLTLLPAALAQASGVEPVYSASTYTRVKSPADGMRFTQGRPIRFLADGIDANGWQWMSGYGESAEVRFFVDGVRVATQGQWPGQVNHFETLLTGLPVGPHVLTTESRNFGEVIRQSVFPVTIHVDPVPAKPNSVDLAADVVLSGTQTLDWTDALVNGNGFRVRSAAGWTGSLRIRNSFVTGLAVTGAVVPPTSAQDGIDVATSGSVEIVDSVFEWTGALSLTVNGAGNVTVTGNEFRANNFIPFVSWQPERSPILTFSGSSTGLKRLQGNRIGAGIVLVDRMADWLIGGDTDAESNLLIGPRCVIDVNGSARPRIRGNYIHHDYHGGWSQGFNVVLTGSSAALTEHNVIYASSWPVQSPGGDFRYNLVVWAGHNWIRSPQSGARIYRNVFINPQPAGYVTEGIWLYGTTTGVQVFNNTFDGSGSAMHYFDTAVTVSNGSNISVLKNNVFTGMVPPASHPLIRRHPDDSDTNPRLGYADYNDFWNPEVPVPDNYAPALVAGRTEGTDGFAGHDLGGVNGQVNPQFVSGAVLPFPVSTDDVWNRRQRVSQILADYRVRYSPAAGSPLIDRGDPADGTGVDVGAVEAPTGLPRVDDLFGRFGGALPPALSVDDLAVMEGGAGTTTSATFTVTLSAASAAAVSVGYAATAGTATAGVDFTPVTGTLSFPPGATSRTVVVPVLGDGTGEEDETFQVSLVSPVNATLRDGDATGLILDDDTARRLHTLAPCRLADTRGPVGPTGGPALSANSNRTFPVAGRCGVPATARAVVVNLVAVNPGAAGNLRVFPAGLALPLASSLNFNRARTRANVGIVALGADGQVTVRCEMAAGSAAVTHFVADVFGYFE